MAIFTKLTKKQLEEFALIFGLSKPSQTKGIVQGTVNTYYKLTTKEGVYYLKVDEVGSLSRLKREIKILKLLDSKKLFFKIPKPLQTKNGNYFVTFKHQFVLIFPEIKGQSIMRLKESHLNQIGQAMALMHLKTKNISLDFHRFNLKEQKNVFKEISKKLLKKHPHVFVQIQKIFKDLKSNKPSKISQGLIHGDLFAENILFGNNKLNGFLDFEAAGLGEFLFDICVCLHALCHDSRKFEFSKIKAYLSGYQKVRKLTQNEKDNFYYYLKESSLRFLLTRLRDFELKSGVVKASPFKDFNEYVRRFDEIERVAEKLFEFI